VDLSEEITREWTKREANGHDDLKDAYKETDCAPLLACMNSSQTRSPTNQPDETACATHFDMLLCRLATWVVDAAIPSGRVCWAYNFEPVPPSAPACVILLWSARERQDTGESQQNSSTTVSRRRTMKQSKAPIQARFTATALTLYSLPCSLLYC